MSNDPPADSSVTSTSPKGRAAGPPWNAFSESCPSRSSLARIANKWTALVVIALGEHPRRFGELLSACEGISKKVLVDTLRALERDGMVLRRLVGDRPEYSLTGLGETLREPLRALQRWAEEHIAEVLEHRSSYDERGDDAVLGGRRRP